MMPTVELVETITRILLELIIPAVALWLCYYVRKWLRGELPVPPHIHEVALKHDGVGLPTQRPD